jgi:hypothetical protein
MRCAFELRAPRLACADMTRVIREKRLAAPDYGQRVGSPFAARPRHGGRAVVAPYHWISFYRFFPNSALGVFSCYVFGGSLFLINDVKRSIGRGKKVVVLCSLEISRIVCRKRSCSAIGSLLIIAAACTIFSAA